MYGFDDLTAPNDENGDAESKSPEDAADRFGIRTALVVLCVGLFIAAIWVTNSPSFQKCSTSENIKDRIACYEGLRNQLLQSPIK
jgi:hypothetical protein